MLKQLFPYFDTRRMLPRSLKNATGDLPPGREMYKEYIRIAVPSVCEMVLISLINMMDTVMVSSIGTDAVAAVGLVGQPRMIMLSLFFALNTGITAVVARRKGEGRRADANATVRTSIIMILVLSALLMALLTPNEDMKKLQDTAQFTELMVRQEEMKTLPFGEIWNEYCRRCGVPEDGKWFSIVQKYEQDVQLKR